MTTLLLAFVGFQTARFLQNRSNVRWAHEKALPEILRLADEEQYVEAFGLARTAQQYIPEDPLLSQAWERISSEITVNTDPPGATVSYREYADGGQDWLQLGRTPLDVRVPIGVFRWRIEKQGYQTREVAFAVADRTITTFVRALTQQLSAAANLGRLDLGLDPNGTVPSGMVPVEPALFVPAALIGFQAPPVQLERFWIDRTEVTNAQFKEFVDAGGYETPEFWPSEFEKDGRHLSWEEAMSLFQDSTGSRGPATWAQGEYKTGHGSFPVGGVSWYEAAAYAAFRGMELPTIYHWAHAALGSSGDLLTEAMVGSSNFADAPGPVGRHAGISAAGANDMAGNVSEWLWNSDGAGQHYVLGGAWSEPSYTFVQPGLESPWRRPSSRGFRCVSYPKGNPEDSLKAPLPLLKTDFRAVPEVSDAVFEAMSSPGAYGPMPLNAVLESATRSPDGREEHITLDAAYRGERLPLTIQFPDGASPPYQSVVFFPGMNGLILTDRRASDALEREALRLFLKGGRAVVRPTYSDMYERNDGRALERLYSHETWNLVFRWRQDLGRVLDYLEEREDMDGGRVAYVGLSLGGLLAPFFLPGERFQAALLWSGGLERYAAEQAAIARVAFLKRTMTPVLMLNGRYDSLLQFEQQKVMFSLLGTPEGEKRHVVYDAGHWPLPAKELIQENLAWLDRYLGTVQKRNPRGDRRGPTGRP
ncbi:MAG: SUMF1/EgtB/PvdO family nonheme iron enzyme [Planctomycetota bacterium]